MSLFTLHHKMVLSGGFLGYLCTSFYFYHQKENKIKQNIKLINEIKQAEYTISEKKNNPKEPTNSSCDPQIKYLEVWKTNHYPGTFFPPFTFLNGICRKQSAYEIIVKTSNDKCKHRIYFPLDHSRIVFQNINHTNYEPYFTNSILVKKYSLHKECNSDTVIGHIITNCQKDSDFFEIKDDSIRNIIT
jgi:hypothetical protein